MPCVAVAEHHRGATHGLGRVWICLNERLELLKVDVDGYEWGALDSLLDSTTVVRDGKVKQLLIEIHVDANNQTSMALHRETLNKLRSQGLVVWHSNVNEYVPDNIELSFRRRLFTSG